MPLIAKSRTEQLNLLAWSVLVSQVVVWLTCHFNYTGDTGMQLAVPRANVQGACIACFWRDRRAEHRMTRPDEHADTQLVRRMHAAQPR